MISYSTVDSIVTFAAALIYLGCVNVELMLCLAAITPFILIVTPVFLQGDPSDVRAAAPEAFQPEYRCAGEH